MVYRVNPPFMAKAMKYLAETTLTDAASKRLKAWSKRVDADAFDPASLPLTGKRGWMTQERLLNDLLAVAKAYHALASKRPRFATRRSKTLAKLASRVATRLANA